MLLKHGRLILLLLVTWSSLGLADRTSGALIEADFNQAQCIAGDAFDTSGAGTLDEGDLIPTEDLAGFTCPSITRGDQTFNFASNGFTADTTNNIAIFSENVLLDGVFNPDDGADKDTSWEFFLFVDEETDLTEDEVFVLAEIAQDNPNPNTWTLDDDYLFRITYEVAALLDTVAVEVVDPNSAEAGSVAKCLLQNSARLSNNVGELYHLVVNVNDKSETGGTTEAANIECFVNGVSAEDAPFTIAESVIDVGASADDYHLFLGTSFETQLVGGGSSVASMPVDMQLFAVYARALTAAEVEANFQNLVSDSLPAASDFSISHSEDSTTEFNFSKGVFDFDEEVVNPLREALGLVADIVDQDLSIRVVVGTTEGALDIGTVPTSVDPLEVVSYVQTVENEDQLVDTTTFFVFQQGLIDQRSEGNSVLSIQYQEANDDPQALSAEFNVAELQTVEVLLTAQDEDDTGDGRVVEAFRPSVFTVTSIDVDQIDGEAVGVFTDCAGGAVAVGDTFDVDSVSDDGLTFTATVCITAASFEGQVDAVLGFATLSYSVQDDSGGDSAALPADELEFREGSAVVTVQQALSSGCQFLEEDLCETDVLQSELDDEGFTTVLLQGFDSRCDGDPDIVDEAVCAEREANRRIVITQPLPDPTTEGTLFFQVGEVFEAISDDSFDEDGKFVVESVTADENLAFALKFKPVTDYFNLSPFPICIDNTRFNDADFEDRGACREDVAFDGQEPLIEVCVGKFCDDDFTTGPFLRDELEPNNPTAPFGVCGDLEAIDDGCPVRINTELAILSTTGGETAFSGPSEDTSHILWVRNVIDSSNTYELNVDDDTEFVLNIGQRTRFDPVIQVLDSDTNARTNMIALTINNGASLFLDEFSDFSESTDEGLTFYDIDSRWGAGINTDFADEVDGSLTLPEGYFIGLTERLNEFLALVEANVAEDSGTTLTIDIEDPFRNNALNTEKIRLAIGGAVVDDGEGDKSFVQELIDRPYTIAGMIVFLFICCFCCYKCFENDTCKCIFVGQRVKLVIVKSAKGIGIIKTKVNETLEDVEGGRKKRGKKKYRNGLSDGPDAQKKRGKAKYKVPQSYRNDDGAVPTKKGLKKGKKNMKEMPAKSYRTEASGSSKPTKARRKGPAPPRGAPPRQDS